ncbi:MAG TPA: MFS transporter [Hyphomicrobiales bacterium]|nr:MFS transporter [Hyphomicrobiales bacterium]
MNSATRLHFQRVQAIGAAITCVATVGIGLSLSVPLLAFAMQARGASATLIGLNTAMAGLATILVAPLVPRTAMHIGVRPLLLLALAVGAATFIGFWLSSPLWLWFPLRFLFGASLAVLFVLSEFWINDVAPDHARGLVMGIYSTALALGFAAGPTLLAAIDRDGPLPYVVGAALFVVAALPLGFAGALAPAIHEPPQSHLFVYLRAAPSAVIAAFVFGAVETGGMSFLPLYGLAMGYGDVASMLLVSILALGNVLVQIPLGFVSDRMDRRRLLILLAVVGALGAAVMPLIAHQTALLFPVVAVWGGLVAGLYTVGLAHLGSQFRGSDLAAANATYILMYSVGILAGPPVLGLGLDIWNPNGLPLTIALLFAIYLFVVIFHVKETPRERTPAAAPDLSRDG